MLILDVASTSVKYSIVEIVIHERFKPRPESHQQSQHQEHETLSKNHSFSRNLFKIT
jgi:hypothetical protein